MPDLRNSAGEPTGAIYGMVGMLRRLRADSKLNGGATVGAVVFDPPGKTFRDDIFPAYKANRAAMPDDLRSQVPLIHEIVAAMGWPIVMVGGVEADDVIGTLARRATQRGMRTRISTGDKDLAQLVDGAVVLFNTMTRDNAPIEMLDAAGVEKRFGVTPDRIVDYLSLVGDTVDNVPGVPKVGPKTAARWIADYGSLDGVIAHADTIKGVVGENLRAALDWLPTARELVTVRMDVDLPPEIAALEPGLVLANEDLPRLRELFVRAGFRTWLREVEAKLQAGGATNGAPAGPSPPGTVAGIGTDARVDSVVGVDSSAGAMPHATHAECVLDEAALEAWIARIEASDIVAFDTETTSLDPMQASIVGLSLAVEPGSACYIPLAHRYPGAPDQLDREQVLARLKSWLENPRAAKVGQNLKYDAHVLANHGVALAGIAHDTMLQSYVLEAHRAHDMDSLARRHLERATIAYADVAGKGAKQIGFDEVSIERATEYAAEDADVTLQLHRVFMPRLQAEPALEHVYRGIEMPTLPVLLRMERNGVLIDPQRLEAQSHELGKRMMEVEARAHEAAGRPFNLGSPKQLGEILFDVLKLPVLKKTASGAASTDEDVLSRLAEDYPLPRIVLDWRSVAKLKSTYTDKLPRMVDPRTGRVHTNYSQSTAVTGRLASTEPNLQNIPIRTPEGRRIREAFIAPAGARIVSCDYSQVELRIMAHISGDAGLLDAFRKGEDVHRATAAEVFGVPLDQVSAEQRRYAKTINFGLIYGMSAYGLAANLNIERDAAKHYIERYFARYPGVADYMERTRMLAREQGYVETVLGRRLWLAEINSPNGPRRQAAERAAINAPMQGTAADLIKLAMVAVQGWLERERLHTLLVMQVHDELVLEVPEDELDRVRASVPELMASVAELKVPLLVETGVGGNWDEAH